MSDDGKAVAYITTDGASSATLHLADIGATEVKVDGLPVDVSTIYWLGPGRVLVVRRQESATTAQVYTAKGPGTLKLGTFDQLALSTIDGRRAIVTYARTQKRGVDHVVAAFAPDSGKLLKRRVWHEDAEGEIKHGNGSLKPLWWSDGFATLAALRAGEYEKARDLRRPDRFTRIDAFSGKVLEEKEVENLLAFMRVSLVRRDAPNQPVVAHFSEDRRRLLLLDGLSDAELSLPRPLGKYEPSTLAFQTLDDRRLALSLTIDPVNPDAVKRQKAEADDIDLYIVDRKARAASLLLQLPGQGRSSSWQLAGHHLLLLRKSKGFDRGGVALEVFEVPDPAPAAGP
jgi:hypothetical protein